MRGPSYALIRSGILDHLLVGRLGFFELGIYTTVHLQVNFSTGIWWGSAPRLEAAGPSGTSLRKVQRGLEHLSEAGFLRSFHVHGSRGNYAVLIDKYDIKLGALKGKRLNAWKSADWRTPVYELCAEGVADGDAEGDAEGAPSQDPVFRSQEVNPLSEASASDAVSSHSPRHKPKLPPSEVGLRLAHLLRERIFQNNRGANVTDVQVIEWARDADRMLQLNSRTEAQITELIEWTQRDSFWKTNILSMAKLREKFDQLTMKKNANGKGGSHAEQLEASNSSHAGFRN